MKEKSKMKYWGKSASIDIYECNPMIIRDAGQICKFVHELCDIIGMKRFGETEVIHFGEEERVAGFSMAQFIETSLISAHFVNITNTVYLDIFSCKNFNVKEAANFAMKFFEGKKIETNVQFRKQVVMKKKPIKVRRKWRINPKTRIKESDKLYSRKKIKLTIQPWEREE